MKKTILISLLLVASTVSSIAHAASNRYQAHWNGKSYLIVDSDSGHMWTFQGDRMIYNGQVDGEEFEPPAIPQIWQLQHGKWSKK